MKIVLSAIVICLIPTAFAVSAQKRVTAAKATGSALSRPREIGQTAVVMDETLSVLRPKPSLFAEPIQRMRRGRSVRILGVAEADGVRFYRVSAPPSNTGWVQADAVFGKFREGDDARLARLVQSMNGFDQIEAAVEFFRLFPSSQFRPTLLLLYGDLLEETAARLSKDAASRLDRREMAASEAPLHSFFLNFVSLDRYRKLGIVFLFNSSTRQFHYNGASWTELVKRSAGTPAAADAQKRLDSLSQKMAKKPAAGNQ